MDIMEGADVCVCVCVCVYMYACMCVRIATAGTSPRLNIVRAAAVYHERQIMLVCPAHREPCKRCDSFNNRCVGTTMLQAEMYSRGQCVRRRRREVMRDTA